MLGVLIPGLAWGLGYPGQPHIVSRFMAIQKERKIPQSALISMVWTVFALYGSMFVGFVALGVLGPDLADPDQAMPMAAVELLPQVLAGIVLASLAFSAFGLIFASIPARSVGSIMMPSTLIRWPLLFVSGVFIPLEEMATWMRTLAYISPLTYAQDLMNHLVPGKGLLNPWLDLVALLLSGVLFLLMAVYLHRRSRRLGY